MLIMENSSFSITYKMYSDLAHIPPNDFIYFVLNKIVLPNISTRHFSHYFKFKRFFCRSTGDAIANV